MHKDDDFDQIGEILNIPVVGHHLRIVPLSGIPPLQPTPGRRVIPTVETVMTFSEFMAGVEGSSVAAADEADRIIDLLSESFSSQHLLLDTPAAGRLGLGRLVESQPRCQLLLALG